MHTWSNKPLKFEDTSMSPALANQGYYKVGNKYFNVKINATIEASRTKEPIEWYFFQDIFDAQIKKPRLGVPLTELYKQRALQLRDKYDYIVLAYSGGADCDNILQTFLRNKIKLDEVWCDQPFTLIEGADYIPTLSTDASNQAIEWYAVVEPELKTLEITNPEIKIHISDSSADMGIEDFDDTQIFSHAPTVYTSIRRYRYIFNYMHKMLDKNINACVIMGIDKVIPHKVNSGAYGFLFSDRAVFLKSHMYGDKACIVESFYWTPDFPAIPVEQAHAVWDVFLKTPEQTHYKIKRRNDEYDRALFSGTYQMDRRYTLDDDVKKICYPWWDFSKIQVNKSSGNLRNQQYKKFIEHFKAERFYQSWYSSVVNIVSQLDRKIAFGEGKQIEDDILYLNNFHVMGEVKW